VGIDVREAWRYGRGKGVVIAVVDSGIVSHPEFSGRVLPGYDFIRSAAVANDGDGRDPDPSDPGNWVTKEEAASGRFAEGCKAEGSDWHGTHVAGIALADADNGIGIAGIAPLARLLPIRVVGKCGGNERDLIDGMRWAAGLEVEGVPINKRPADIINLSLGGEASCSAALQAAVDEIVALDVAIVAAVGNESQDASTSSPANCFGTATVAALTVSGDLAAYSNYGSFVDLSAPGGGAGGGIVSTVDRGTRTPEGPGYASYAGTSMAAPHLSGVLAIARGYDPLTPFEALYEVLFGNLAPFNAVGGPQRCNQGLCGAGALDAGRYMAALESRSIQVVESIFPVRLAVGAESAGGALVDGIAASDFQLETPEICGWDGVRLIGISRGDCRLSLERPGTATLKPLNASIAIEIGGLTPTITQQLPARIGVGSSARAMASADSGGLISYSSRTPAICKVGGKGRVTGLTVGDCKLRIAVGAAGDFDAGRVRVELRVRRR
jgi:serine protease